MKQIKFKVKIYCRACSDQITYSFKKLKGLNSDTKTIRCPICTVRNTVTVNY